MAFEPNRTASAVVAPPPGRTDRPWVIAVHGFCMGFPFMDFQGLQAARIHHELGMNVALPVLPLHGSRRVTLVSGEPLLSFELMNTVHGLTQAVWDIRRLIHRLREQGATSISLYGVSLGWLHRLTAGRHRRGGRRGGGRYSGVGFPGALQPAQSTPHPGPFHRAQDHGRGGRERLPGGLARCVSKPRCPWTADSSSPGTATAWPPPARHNASGNTGGSPVSRGIRAIMSATSGPDRSPNSSWIRSARSRRKGPPRTPGG